MRALLLLSLAPLALALQAGQTSLPAPLARDFETLKAAPSLTVEYTVRTVGEGPATEYKLELSRPGLYRLTGPDGTVSSDGKTVVTYDKKTNTYTETPASPATDAAFAARREVFAWAPFFQAEPGKGLTSAILGKSRTVGGTPIREVTLGVDKLGYSPTLYLDEKLGVARGLIAEDSATKAQTLVVAKTVTIGKEALSADTFAFVAPAGATKAVVVLKGFPGVQALLADRCLPCHASARPRAGIALDSYAGIVAAVTPGDPNASLLIKSVKGDGVRKMPLGNHPALSDAEIKQLSDWIAAGAKNE